MKLTVPIAGLGLVLLAGLAGGWSLHARQFSGKQVAWMDSVKVYRAVATMALRDSRNAKAEADSLRAEAAGDAQAATRLEAAQRQNAVASRLAQSALTAARTTGDSLRAAIQVVVAVQAERDTALAMSDAWRRAYQREFQAANRLTVRGDSLEKVVARQDQLLATGLRVTGQSGCRVPLIGLKCPEVVAGYGLTADLTGSSVEVRRGIQVTVGWRIL